MSVLPAGQSLGRFLPDLEDLLHDPRSYLAEEPVTIGPRQMYGLAFLFGFAGSAFLLAGAIVGQGDGERLALGIGLLLGGERLAGLVADDARPCTRAAPGRRRGAVSRYGRVVSVGGVQRRGSCVRAGRRQSARRPDAAGGAGVRALRRGAPGRHADRAWSADQGARSGNLSLPIRSCCRVATK